MESSAEESNDDKPPYSMEYVVKFCRSNWTRWVNLIHKVLVETQKDLEEQVPTLKMTKVVKGLELLLPPMIQVSINSSTTFPY